MPGKYFSRCVCIDVNIQNIDADSYPEKNIPCKSVIFIPLGPEFYNNDELS